VLPPLLVVVGVAWLALSATVNIPAFAVVAAIYLIGAWWLSRSHQRSSGRLLRNTVAAVAITAGIVLTAAVGYLAARGSPPAPDAFYESPAAVPAEPGTLLRAEPFTRVVPSGTQVWRILYTTTRSEHVPAIASAIVLAPREPTSEPRPVVAWTHGTTGVAVGCAPSVLPAPFPFDATVPALPQLIAARWILVATDYVGLGTAGGHPYLIGESEGRSALDAIRAVRQMSDVKVDTRTVVWGHSQGGHAALWTGILAPRYAPELRIAGVAALAPATDLGPLMAVAQHTPVGKIMASFVMTAYSDTYRDVGFGEYVGPVTRARAMASRCISGPGAVLSLLTSLTMEREFFVRSPGEGPLSRRFQENVPTGAIPSPLLIAQGLRDDLVLPAVQERFVRERCTAGQALQYRTYTGRRHLSLVAADSPLTQDLVQWTRDRFAGVAPEAGCRTVTR
jgi:pimeloyl-ACP methyl ester carboxylesterase